MKAYAYILALFVFSGCASGPSPATPPANDPRLVLLLVGGNSEAIHNRGIWTLYKGEMSTSELGLLKSIKQQTKLDDSEIAAYYFSWTGDDEGHRTNWLPGHANWITGGPDWILKAIEGIVPNKNASTRVAIIGWSNGAATAYELACTLSAARSPELLVTLDPVAWTTRPCSEYSGGRAATPINWVNIYTESGPWNRLNTGNIIAFIGRAWDNDKLPSKPANKSLHKSEGTNHGQTEKMWELVLKDETFLEWAASFQQK